MSEKLVSGMKIYYYFVCRKKLWYFSNEINMESENENVQLGKILDESTYKNRKKHIMIDNIINIDYIAEHNVLHEVKKSRKIEEAGIWQIKYYLYYLKRKGVSGLTGRVDYPLLKQSIRVELSEEDEKLIGNIIEDIITITSSALPPECEAKRFCKSCAYYDLCWI